MHRERIPVAREGVPFIGIAALASLVSAILGLTALATFFILLTMFILWFFRDPDRVVPSRDGSVVAPADGVVVEVADKITVPFFKEYYSGRKDYVKIGIFMNVFDVHVNRSPLRGAVREICWFPGRFMSADRLAASVENERCAMLIEDCYGRYVTVVQVAGLIARRIVCRAEPGDELKAGERYGLIRFGSRVDIYLSSRYTLFIREGERVIAGQSIIGAMQR